jgi:hypothetical protein
MQAHEVYFVILPVIVMRFRYMYLCCVLRSFMTSAAGGTTELPYTASCECCVRKDLTLLRTDALKTAVCALAYIAMLPYKTSS